MFDAVRLAFICCTARFTAFVMDFPNAAKEPLSGKIAPIVYVFTLDDEVERLPISVIAPAPIAAPTTNAITIIAIVLEDAIAAQVSNSDL